MEPIARVTTSTIDVLYALLDHEGTVWGLLVVKSTERAAGTVYPILERLEGRGWITSTWEESERSGPRRRLYEFTPDGRAAATEARAEFRRRQLPERRPSGRPVSLF